MNRSSFLKVVCSIVLAAVAAPAMLLGATGERSQLSVGDLTANKSMGSRQAPITVEVFADFQCPQCRNLYLTTTRQLIDNYVTTGKVLLVHHDFPLSMHTYSHQAARWASAARRRWDPAYSRQPWNRRSIHIRTSGELPETLSRYWLLWYRRLT